MMEHPRGTNRTGHILVWKVLPVKGQSFWVKQNPLGMAQILISKATADQLIQAGAIHLDDFQIVRSGREITINL
jgi:hypothetical protein